MKGVAGLTRRFFNNSIQTHTFFETDLGACQANGGRVVPVYWRSNWRLLEAEVGIGQEHLSVPALFATARTPRRSNTCVRSSMDSRVSQRFMTCKN